MPNLVPSRKRKGAHNPPTLPHDTGKVRLVEYSERSLSSNLVKPSQAREDLLANRALNNLRRGGIRIFSIFRNGKGTWLHML